MELFKPDDVLRRASLLTRIAEDVCSQYETRRRKQERLEELVVISRKFSSSEIQETINNLRTHIADCKRDIESCEKEIRSLGGTLHDHRRGVVYFTSQKDGRPILLVWDSSNPKNVSWHEVDESFADRNPIEFPRGAGARS